MTHTRAVGPCILLVLAAIFAGCGSKGPERFQVSGKATMNGNPIPAGEIYFDPVGQGMQGYAPIKNGQFDTRQGGRGHSGGPMAARIAAYDGVAANELPLGKPLMSEVIVKLDLARQDGMQDIDAAQGTPLGGGSVGGETVARPQR